jgi:hypothetical protein
MNVSDHIATVPNHISVTVNGAEKPDTPLGNAGPESLAI